MQKSWMKLQTLKKVPSINFKMLRDWHALFGRFLFNVSSKPRTKKQNCKNQLKFRKLFAWVKQRNKEKEWQNEEGKAELS